MSGSSIFATLALVSSASFAAEPGLTNPADTLLTLTATGNSTRVPDIATLSAGVATTGRTAGQAIAANAAAMAHVGGALADAGIAARDIQTSNLSLTPNYSDRNGGDNAPPRIIGYQANNNLTVRVHDVARAGAVVDALVGAGANEVSGPSFSVEHPEAALDEARLAAIGNDRVRADLYARAIGLHVARIISISESGGDAPQPIMMRARINKASTPIAPGEVALNVEVSMQFELAPGAMPAPAPRVIVTP